MTDKPSTKEEEYFAKENAERLRKLALEQHARLAEGEKEQLKKAHWMRCPKCGMELHTVAFRGVELDTCFGCHGHWLDAGELEKLAAGNDHTLMQAVLNVFAHKKSL